MDSSTMPGRRRRILRSAGTLAAAAAVAAAAAGCGSSDSSAASGSNYPQRNIKLIVPFATGGGSDIIARSLVPCIRNDLPRHVNIVVENIDAAGGRAGTFQIYDAKPDGYTIGILDPFTLPLAQTLGQAGDREVQNVTWLARTSSASFMLVAHSGRGLDSVRDLPGKHLRVAVSAAVIPPSVVVLDQLGVKSRFVTYGGGSDAGLAVARGDVDIAINSVATLKRQMDSTPGKIVPLAVLGAHRAAELPKVPTAEQAGLSLPSKFDPLLAYYYVLAAPPKLPSPIATTLTGAIRKALADPKCTTPMKNAGVPSDFASAADMRAAIGSIPDLIKPYAGAIKEALAGQ